MWSLSSKDNISSCVPNTNPCSSSVPCICVCYQTPYTHHLQHFLSTIQCFIAHCSWVSMPRCCCVFYTDWSIAFQQHNGTAAKKREGSVMEKSVLSYGQHRGMKVWLNTFVEPCNFFDMRHTLPRHGQEASQAMHLAGLQGTLCLVGLLFQSVMPPLQVCIPVISPQFALQRDLILELHIGREMLHSGRMQLSVALASL